MGFQSNGAAAFFLLGVVVHFVLLYSILDIYYSSPIVKGARPHPFYNTEHAAKRLVVFSADGLRSRSFFQHPEKSPYLHSLIRNVNCSWGVSNSHVPTESRPGHVAMMAGIFEDVSAVTRGWTKNPVSFDSLFNQSRKSFLFGSPDIVPMFGESVPSAEMFYYSDAEEDFSRKDASFLDRWVFDKVETILEREDEALNGDKTLFFLHLLGLDTNGHGHKPNSDEYKENILVVDEGIKKVVDLFEARFPDKRTAYLFTADHGMTDWGSHGSGTEDEILTPFVVWGHGVQRLPQRTIVQQVDLTPLQAALLGIPIPVNSLGILPLNLLRFSARQKCNAACTNLKQMVEQFGIKRAEKERNSFKLLFKEFPGFKASVLNKVDNAVSNLLKNKRFDAAAQMCIEWVPRVRSGLYYFHRYHRTSLGIAVASLFLGWITLLYVFMRWGAFRDINTFKPPKVAVAIMTFEVVLSIWQNWPWAHLVFYALPTYVFGLSWNGHRLNLPQLNLILSDVRNTLGFYMAAGLLFILLVVVSVSAFYQRSLISVVLIFTALFPIITATPLHKWSKVWLCTNLLLAVFPLFPPVGKVPIPTLTVVAPLLSSAIIFYYGSRFSSAKQHLTIVSALIFISSLCNLQLAATGSSMLITRLFSWLSLVFGLICPFTVRKGLIDRFVVSLACTYLIYSLLSVAYESVFLLAFTVLLYCYVRLERSDLNDEDFRHLPLVPKSDKPGTTRLFEIDQQSLGPFERKEWQRAALLVILIEVAFFGTGNLASLNGFNPSSIRNFISTFSPFTMAALLIFKIAVPFLQLAFAFSTVLQYEPREGPRLAVLLMIITDVMALIFFFHLKDEGSWLDIGMTISHYVICLSMSSAVFILLHFARWLMTYQV